LNLKAQFCVVAEFQVYFINKHESAKHLLVSYCKSPWQSFGFNWKHNKSYLIFLN